jgi:hypothetical protein
MSAKAGLEFVICGDLTAIALIEPPNVSTRTLFRETTIQGKQFVAVGRKLCRVTLEVCIKTIDGGFHNVSPANASAARSPGPDSPVKTGNLTAVLGNTTCCGAWGAGAGGAGAKPICATTTDNAATISATRCWSIETLP